MYSALGLTLNASAFPSTAPAPALPSCVSQTVHDQAVKECQNLTVKGVGLGVVGYEQYGACALSRVPVCLRQSAPAPTLVRQSPATTSTATPFVKIPADLFSTPPPAPAYDKKNLIVGGLIAVLLVGGSVVAYKTLKKKG